MLGFGELLYLVDIYNINVDPLPHMNGSLQSHTWASPVKLILLE